MLKLFSKIEKYTKVYIYGVGELAQLVFDQLMDNNISLMGFFGESVDYNKKIGGISISGIESLGCVGQENIALIYAEDVKNDDNLIKCINVLGKENVFMLSNLEVMQMKQSRGNRRSLRNQQLMQKIQYIDFTEKKVLIVAPHPDDEVIGCGGFLAMHNYKDVLCINSSGVKYEWDLNSAEEIAEIRVNEFENVMSMIGAGKFFINKIWGNPPMFKSIMKNWYKIVEHFDFSEYDYIFVPHLKDCHREHRFLSSYLMPKVLKECGYKNTLKICFYEVWSPMEKPNFYLDISDYYKKKIDYINAYESRKAASYAKRILGLNQYRGLIGKCEYAEAYEMMTVEDYLQLDFDNSWGQSYDEYTGLLMC